MVFPELHTGFFVSGRAGVEDASSNLPGHALPAYHGSPVGGLFSSCNCPKVQSSRGGLDPPTCARFFLLWFGEWNHMFSAAHAMCVYMVAAGNIHHGPHVHVPVVPRLLKEACLKPCYFGICITARS